MIDPNHITEDMSDLSIVERGIFITILCLQQTSTCLKKAMVDFHVPNAPQKVIDKFIVDSDGCFVYRQKAKRAKRTPMTRPTVEECQSYLEGKFYDDLTHSEIIKQAQRFHLHYESNGWKVGKNPMRNWKSALSGWILRNEKRNGYQEKLQDSRQKGRNLFGLND